MTITDDEKAQRQLKLWFFRDLSDEQRLALFRIMMHEVPPDQLRTQAAQSAAFAHIVQSLRQSSPPDGQTAPKPFTLSWWNSKDLMVSITELGEVMVNDREAFQALFDAMPEVEHGGIKCIHVRPTPSSETTAPGEKH